MAMIENILFPVDFSPSCYAIAAYVQRVAALFTARVTLLHVLGPAAYNGFDLVVRPSTEIDRERELLAHKRLRTFRQSAFPGSSEMLVRGDAATQIAGVAKKQASDLIVLPTHAGSHFRRMLLGSVTANVLHDVTCPVLTTEHAEVMTPRPIKQREIACALKLDQSSTQILTHAAQLAQLSGSRLTIIHAVPQDSNHLMLPLNLDESSTREQREAEERLEHLSRDCGGAVQVRVVSGPAKDAILDTARRLSADVLVIGRSSRKGLRSHLSDLGYALIRDSDCPVLSI